MSSPPRGGGGGLSPSSSGLRSPSTSSSQPFIYPMRSVVSVKPPTRDAAASEKSTSHNDKRGSISSIASKNDHVHESPHGSLKSDLFPEPDGSSSMSNSGCSSEDEHQEDNHHSDDFVTTTRFEHIETEEGHMIITGRGGELARCEDEPIHSPGAIQSFGCMVVLRSNDEGELIVRQASENTGEILGLKPSYLFSLESFLDVLEDSQADLLWDNIDSLDQTGQDLLESGPAVFQLRGMTETTIRRGRQPGDDDDKCSWTAWCAAHIPVGPSETDSHELTIVLEFELVNDTNMLETSPPLSPTLESSSRAESASSKTESPPPSISTVSTDGTVQSTAYEKLRYGLEGMPYRPSPEELRESTEPVHAPLKALTRMRRPAASTRGGRLRGRRGKSTKGGADGAGGLLDMIGVLSQVNEQFSAQTELQSFLKVVVGIVRDITNFSRVMVYQFDELWNGQVVCELVDYNDTHDLYRGLHFPATDIPAQARALYKINKIRLLYDRDQPTARLVCKSKEDLENPVDMTHALLRAMSPVHIKYLVNMGVKSSMSISIVVFGELWGLISLHNYGNKGKRVSFPIRQLSRLIGESVSLNIERLSYTRRLSARKLINTLPTDQNPSGYIISNAEDLLTLFDADFGVIAIGNEAKILGPLSASQEVLAVTEYLRLKKFEHLVTSQDVRKDFPDMVIPNGLEVIAGLLLVPLSGSGVDFIAFLRKSQLRHINWAGKPFKEGKEGAARLEPRKSFKIWSQTIVGTCRAWKDEELETASVLCLVYGKFISVWRQREQALHYNQLNRLLLSNASHEVRTPLNHIINYLELALDSKLDEDTRENLSKSHMASKSLLFVINDLLDLTKQEQGNKLFLQEPFDLAATVREAVEMHEWEAKRRKIDFTLVTEPAVCMVSGDRNRIRQVITNTVTNSVKYTAEGHIHVSMRKRPEDEMNPDLPEGCDMEVELIVTDTGEGIPREKLEAIFREFEQVETVYAVPSRSSSSHLSMAQAESSALVAPQEPGEEEPPDSGLGLGLAIVARIVKNLGGQLRVDSTVGEGSTFTYYIPFASAAERDTSGRGSLGSHSMKRTNSYGSGSASSAGNKSEIDSLVEAIQQPILRDSYGIDDASHRRRSLDGVPGYGPVYSHGTRSGAGSLSRPGFGARGESFDGIHPVEGSSVPVRSVRIEPQGLDLSYRHGGQGPNRDPIRSSRQKTAAEVFKEEVQMSQKMDESVRKDAEARSLNASPRRAQRPPNPHKNSSDVKTGVSAMTVDLNATTSESNVRAYEKPKIASSVAARRRAQIGRMARPSVATNKCLPPMRVLVVEDDPINGMILKKRLGMDGHNVSLAVNGEEGVRQFEEDANEMDIILMDLQMPICNGQEACKRIRKLEEERERTGQLKNRPAIQILNGRIPIIAVSATLTPEMREEMTSIGMDGWVLKPIDFSRLGSLMKGLLSMDDRRLNQWEPGYHWEMGGFLSKPARRSMQEDA
ncbi:hypothetical protein IE53DRAFT_137357 [Violaceomyces palustris]|uniref:Uncharacterized protein n=1 Tax=Violaceomyces palustris TaxID=1673888 RepID=A0ACD0P6I4_9BASI|nr:hypothetical protein IE53DRAFT_137357 [Violaceomyces palustris]